MYRYELHMHTKEGSACAACSIGEMIRRFKEIGFSGAVVTNHFFGGNTSVDRFLPWYDFVNAYARAYYDGLNEAERLDFDLLFGLEEQYGGGKEILVYGIEPDFLAERPQLRGASLRLWSKEVHSVGGFVAYAHPFRDRAYIKNPKEMPDVSLVDGVEVYNFCNTAEENREAAEAFSEKSIVSIAGSDLHNTDFDSAYGVYLPKRVKTSKELAKLLLAGDFRMAL